MQSCAAQRGFISPPRRTRATNRDADVDQSGNGFDALIIGMGQAGPSLAGRLAGAGMKVAVVEQDKFGGTCVNNGCTPTKAMVASAYAAHLARRSGEYGVIAQGTARIDMKRVKARKDAIVKRSEE